MPHPRLPPHLQLESCQKHRAAAAEERQRLEAELAELRAAAQRNGSAAGAASEDAEDGQADAQELIAVLRQQLQEAQEAAAKVRPGSQDGAALLLEAMRH